MDLSAEQLLQQREGALHVEASDEPTQLIIHGPKGEESYALTPSSLPQLEAAARAMEGFRPAGKTSDDFVRILSSFMPPEDAKRFVDQESIPTVIKTMRGLTERTSMAMAAASGQEVEALNA